MQYAMAWATEAVPSTRSASSTPSSGSSSLKRLSSPAVLVVDAAAQIGDVLAEGLDEVLDRFEDPRADRAVGDREQALAGHVARKRRVVEPEASATSGRPAPGRGRGRSCGSSGRKSGSRRGCPSGSMPNRSWISLSYQAAERDERREGRVTIHALRQVPPRRCRVRRGRRRAPAEPSNRRLGQRRRDRQIGPRPPLARRRLQQACASTARTVAAVVISWLPARPPPAPRARRAGREDARRARRGRPRPITMAPAIQSLDSPRTTPSGMGVSIVWLADQESPRKAHVTKTTSTADERRRPMRKAALDDQELTSEDAERRHRGRGRGRRGGASARSTARPRRLRGYGPCPSCRTCG